MSRIYLDYNASTPIDPLVAAAMKPFFDDHYGNPSSGHWATTAARAAVETARSQIAALLGCHSDEVVLTSGGSEANNLALKGVFFALRHKGDHIVTTGIEHPAIIEPCRFLESLGARVTYLPVDRAGRVDPDGVRNPLTSRTILVSIMHANNEVGTIQPTKRARRLRAIRGSCFTPTRRNRSGRFRPTSISSASIFCRSPATSSTPRRASARCSCVGGPHSLR